MYVYIRLYIYTTVMIMKSEEIYLLCRFLTEGSRGPAAQGLSTNATLISRNKTKGMDRNTWGKIKVECLNPVFTLSTLLYGHFIFLTELVNKLFSIALFYY